MNDEIDIVSKARGDLLDDSFGEDAEVISPKFIQNDLHQIIRKLYARLPGAMTNEP